MSALGGSARASPAPRAFSFTASFQFHREQEAADAKEKLDAAVGNFLDLLQGCLLLPPALRTLEYLTRQYK